MVSRLYVTWQRCTVDRQDHAITDEEFAYSDRRGEGRRQALCGHVVTLDSAMCPPGRRCELCYQHVRAQETLRGLEQRKARPTRHRKPGRWRRLASWLRTPTATSSRGGGNSPSSHRADWPQIPVGASREPSPLAPTGDHTKARP